MKLTLLALAFMSAAWGDVIGVTGTGMTFRDLFDAVDAWSLSFQGSDGVNSVSAQYDSPDQACGLGATCFPRGFSGSGATIDGQHFASGFFSFVLGGDAGSSITGYDSNGQPAITQQLSAYIQMTSLQCSGEDFFTQDCTGTFAVLATPEPSTWLLTAAGLTAFLRRRRETQN